MNQPKPGCFSILEEETSRIVDLRGLEAPEPMVKILLSCSELGPHDTFIGRIPHAPHPLFPHLQARGLEAIFGQANWLAQLTGILLVATALSLSSMLIHVLNSR